jgi:perosamine synthetase
LSNKRKLALIYKEFFADKELMFIEEPQNSNSNYWLNSIIFKDKEQRNLFLEETNKNGLMCRPIWTLMNKLAMFKDAECDELENAKWLESRVVNIPSSFVI